MAFPRGGSSSTVSRSNWNLEVLVFDERGKPEYPEKNLSEQSREPTTKMFGKVRQAFGTILENLQKSSESGRKSSENRQKRLY